MEQHKAIIKEATAKPIKLKLLNESRKKNKKLNYKKNIRKLMDKSRKVLEKIKRNMRKKY